MKKITLLLLGLAAMFATTQAQAQTQTTTKEKYLNVGIGLAPYTAGGIPVGASFEVDIRNNISAGAFLDYTRYGYNYGGYKWHYNFLYFGVRGSYHLKDVVEALNMDNSKFDPYAGVALGVRTVSFRDNAGNDTFNSPYSSGMLLGIHVGSRYYFSENIGGFAEVGYGVSALKLGVTAKF